MARIPVQITTFPHLGHHHFMGRPVLPAVEAMEILAAAVHQTAPHHGLTAIHDARFDKFLPLDMDLPEIAAFADVQQVTNEGWEASLVTKTTSSKAAITRTKVHARLSFARQPESFPSLPLDVAAVPAGVCVRVSPEKIYKELVPFGPTYANIKAPLWLSTDGALAAIQCPDKPSPSGSHHLGSPFALDAAFHAACVWGQHFYPVVAFPVGLDRRVVLQPARAHTPYYARVVPKQTSPEQMVFDVWLLDGNGNVCEAVLGLQMRDVSGGRLAPPDWIVRKDPPDPLAALGSHCRQLTVLELDAVAPFASQALSPIETRRMAPMGSRRKRSYVAARLALKRLSRKLGGENQQADSRSLCTLEEDQVRPRCPVSPGTTPVYCSAAHDSRFAVAVAAHQPVGVDVEIIASKTVQCAHIYMTERETDLMRRSDLGSAKAATRIWSLKEAVAKATGLDLATTWQRIETQSVDAHQSAFTIEGQGPFTAQHAEVEAHLFTLTLL